MGSLRCKVQFMCILATTKQVFRNCCPKQLTANVKTASGRLLSESVRGSGDETESLLEHKSSNVQNLLKLLYQ